MICLGIIRNRRTSQQHGGINEGRMDSVNFISDCLAQVEIRLLGTCEGMTQEEVLWRPAPYANNIGFILWHVTRAEDNLVTRLGDGPPCVGYTGPGSFNGLRPSRRRANPKIDGGFDRGKTRSAHRLISARAERRRKFEAFNHPQKQPPRSGGLYPWSPEPDLGPATPGTGAVLP